MCVKIIIYSNYQSVQSRNVMVFVSVSVCVIQTRFVHGGHTAHGNLRAHQNTKSPRLAAAAAAILHTE